MSVGDFPLGTFKKDDDSVLSDHTSDSPNVTLTIIKRGLAQAREAKRKHKDSNQCDHPNGCTACHYWSGVISALSELLGEPGVID